MPTVKGTRRSRSGSREALIICLDAVSKSLAVECFSSTSTSTSTSAREETATLSWGWET